MSTENKPNEDVFEDRCHPDAVASGPFKFKPPVWREDNTCSHCGGMRPSLILAAIKSGAEVCPTDKSYKIYVTMPDPDVGKPKVVSVMNFTPEDYNPAERGYVKADPEVLKASGWSGENAHWMMIAATLPTREVKCYLNHFSESQALEFVRLVETKQMKLAYPGRFYRPLAFGRYKDAIERLLAELKTRN